MINVCGFYCEKDCSEYNNGCKGCQQLKGKISWAIYLNRDTCPIYSCCHEKNLDHCGQCPDIPCKIWLKTKDPRWSHEEFIKDVERRVKILKNLK